MTVALTVIPESEIVSPLYALYNFISLRTVFGLYTVTKLAFVNPSQNTGFRQSDICERSEVVT